MPMSHPPSRAHTRTRRRPLPATHLFATQALSCADDGARLTGCTVCLATAAVEGGTADAAAAVELSRCPASVLQGDSCKLGRDAQLIVDK